MIMIGMNDGSFYNTTSHVTITIFDRIWHLEFIFWLIMFYFISIILQFVQIWIMVDNYIGQLYTIEGHKEIFLPNGQKDTYSIFYLPK